MKKSLIYIALLISLSSYAQTNTMPSPMAEKMNRVFSYQPGPDLKKGAQKVLQATPKQAAKAVGGYIVTNKGKSALGVAAVGSVAAYSHLIKNPEKTERYFSKNPQMLEKFSEYVNYRIEHAQSEKEYNTFANVKDKLYLDTDLNLLEEEAIKNNALYQGIEQEVRREIAVVDTQLVSYDLPNKCSINNLNLLLERKGIFESTTNAALPFVRSQPKQTYVLDVNSHKALKNGYGNTTKPIKLEMDHIPSYAAIETFLMNKGISVKKFWKIENGKKKISRNYDLEANTTTIAIPEEIHQKGRTFGGRNQKNRILTDSHKLLEATILDISMTAYIFSLDYTNGNSYNISAQNYIKSVLTVYIRNKLLCLYDIK